MYADAPDGYANLRTRPGTECDILCQIQNDESLEVYQEEATAKNGSKWLKVAYYSWDDEDWITGWMDRRIAACGVK